MSKPRTPDTIYVSYIVAAPEKVWQALTNPEFTEKFFLGRMVEVRLGASRGRRGFCACLTVASTWRGRVLELETPRRLRLSWRVVWVEEWRHLPESSSPTRSNLSAKSSVSHDGIPNPEPIDEKDPGGLSPWLR